MTWKPLFGSPSGSKLHDGDPPGPVKSSGTAQKHASSPACSAGLIFGSGNGGAGGHGGGGGADESAAITRHEYEPVPPPQEYAPLLPLLDQRLESSAVVGLEAGLTVTSVVSLSVVPLHESDHTLAALTDDVQTGRALSPP